VLSTRIEAVRLSQLRAYAAANGQTQSTAARELLLLALERVAA
jgi:hypothetical protein